MNMSGEERVAYGLKLNDVYAEEKWLFVPSAPEIQGVP